ncbi:MAG: hypothetical protein K2J31_04825 [Alistipes sp.]|nr:hypothetical protein [Alistipes sp.]
MKNVFFLPWEGAESATGGIFGKRILVLGESHYCQDHDAPTENLTREAVEKYLAGEYIQSFKLFEQSLVGAKTDMSQRRQIWDSLLFYNFVQNPLGETPRQKLAVDNPDRSTDAFFEVLEEHRPQYIIAWGYRLWDKAMPTKRWTWGDEIVIEGLPPIKFGYYTLADGTRVKAVPVKHPSAGYSWSKWHQFIEQFLK